MLCEGSSKPRSHSPSRVQSDWVSEPGGLHQGKRSMRKALKACSFPKEDSLPKRRGIVRVVATAYLCRAFSLTRRHFTLRMTPKLVKISLPFLFLGTLFKLAFDERQRVAEVRCRKPPLSKPPFSASQEKMHVKKKEGIQQRCPSDTSFKASETTSATKGHKASCTLGSDW